jgi:hypothetical protein
MAMIFGDFPDEAAARAFAKAAKGRFYDTYEAADADDRFPFHFELPVVHVDRIIDANDDIDIEAEQAMAALAQSFGGAFIGT